MKKTAYFRCVCDKQVALALEGHDDIPPMHCECGAVTTVQRVSYGDDPPPPQADAPMCFAKGREFTFNKKMNIPSMGRFVRSDEEQHAIYQGRVAECAKKARENRRSRSKRNDIQWEHVARVPLEMHESAIETQGDKLFWNSDTENKLKRMGVWFGD